jgi:hypothetical protein
MPINSQAKGKRAERDLANWWKLNGFPDAARAVKTGDRFTPDAGDLILQYGDFRLVVEVKHHAGGLTTGDVSRFGEKLQTQTRQSGSHMGVLVERRDRVANAGDWWLWVDDFVYAALLLERGVAPIPASFVHMVRLPVHRFAKLLRVAGLAQPMREVVSSLLSPPDGAAPEAETVTNTRTGT